MTSTGCLRQQPGHSHEPGLGLNLSMGFEDAGAAVGFGVTGPDAVVVVLVAGVGLGLAAPVETVVFGLETAEISGLGIFAKIDDVVMGTAGPSFSANGDPRADWFDEIFI